MLGQLKTTLIKLVNIYYVVGTDSTKFLKNWLIFMGTNLSINYSVQNGYYAVEKKVPLSANHFVVV